jgi:hypothetical protein
LNNVEIYWHDDQKTILRQVFHSGLTSEQALAGITYGRVLLDAVSHKVTLLTEIRQPLILPKGYLNVIRSTAPRIRPTEVLHVVVGSPILIRSVIQIAARLSIPNMGYFAVAGTVEQGLEMCHRALAKTSPLIESS